MDRRLKNENCILKRILKWLDDKPRHLEESFCCDFHIDQWCKIASKADWFDVGMAMYALLQNNIGKSHPHLKVMIAFCLSATYQPRIPKTLSRRNSRERNYTPPIIYLYSDKLDEKEYIMGDCTFLPDISEKFRLKAYYQEIKEDVYYRLFSCSNEILVKNMPMNHPYKAFENTEQWKSIRQAIEELIENDDLELHTPIEYVVGAICQELASDETSAQMKEKYKTSSMKIRR